MSVYKPPNKPYFHFDFWFKRRRFFGSTGTANRREAEAVERAQREKARALVKHSTADVQAMTLDIAAGRYWQEVGQHYVNALDTERDLGRLVGWLGRDKLLIDVTDEDVNDLVAWRRGHRVKNGTKFVSAATVNRSTVQVLQAIFTRAKKKWAIRLDHEPDWRDHRLEEPQERVRELRDDEAKRIDAATRDDYAPFLEFVRASGQRLEECLLRWLEVNWEARQIIKTGKGGRKVVVPITSTIREILWPLRGHHPEFVFTYVAQRTRDGRIKGQRYPLSYSGVKTAWRRLRAAAGVSDFRFHDFRHDFATKLLRETGNLKLVQKALNHADIKTTSRYAHVLDNDLREGLERVQKSRHQSRPTRRSTG